MKYNYNWLKNILGLTKSTPEEKGEDLAVDSSEIEGLEKQTQKFDGVVVGRILEIEKHPNADRLQVTKTDIGGEILQIVCGAPNIQVGQLVPVATVGTKLSNGLEIKEAEIRGVKSFGMLCAADELGLGSDHSGIMVLDEKAEVGMKFVDYINNLSE
ncbi:MAG: hypothetical protein Q7T51_04535 [Candidatus Moranbacteria bacterium]|nr:hypothetical protein [Candidatus Moranbacteria bacterium]